MKVYSAIYNNDAHLNQLGYDAYATVFDPKHLDSSDGILILHGGSDISPAAYGRKPNKHTMADDKLSPRDEVEIALARQAFRMNMPIYGICRGAQLLCALAGGTLVQHSTGHNNGKHNIETHQGYKMSATSAHHQMMNLDGTENELLAWTAPIPLSNKYLGEDGEHLDIKVEPEVVFFPKLKALAVQGHPEWMGGETAFVRYCLSLISEKLLCCTV
jgi:hypothetical protein